MQLANQVENTSNTVCDEGSISTSDLNRTILKDALNCFPRQVLLGHCQCESTAPHNSVVHRHVDTSFIPRKIGERV